MAATANAVGSWFPSGYYGHFRSKSRNDFMCEFRQLAKPQPPKKFIQRARQPTPKHVFSHHDNRESFLNDALYFEQGLGRKRVPNETYNFKPDFITWMPEREYVQRTRPLTSSYRYDFKQKSVPRQKPIKISTGVGTNNVLPLPTEKEVQTTSVPQLIVKRPKTSFDGVPTTSYRYAHGDINPNKQLINAMNNDALQLSLLNRKNRAMSANAASGRESVASCLVWYNPEYERKVETPKPRSTVPAATQTIVYAPHPPAPRQPVQDNCQSRVPQPQVVLNNVEPPAPQAVQPVVMETVQSLPPAQPAQETTTMPATISWSPPQQTAPPVQVPLIQAPPIEQSVE